MTFLPDFPGRNFSKVLNFGKVKCYDKHFIKNKNEKKTNNTKSL